jgi:hypothetical protein
VISEDSTPNRKDLSSVFEKDWSPIQFYKSKIAGQLRSDEGNSTSYEHALLPWARYLDITTGFDNLGDLFDKNFLFPIKGTGFI